MKNKPVLCPLTTLPYVVLALSGQAFAVEPLATEASSGPVAISAASETPATTASPQAEMKALPTLTLKAKAAAKDTDLSAVAKTVVTRDEMEKYGDQSVSDALRRATGFQMPVPGQGPRGGGGASGMRFRGGGAPTFLINGEPVQGGPRGAMSLVDNLTTEMIDRIEIVKQPSVAQAAVASSAVINIILKQPLNDQFSGVVKLGYGLKKSDRQQEQRLQLTLQGDGRKDDWSYSVSASQNLNDSTLMTQTQTAVGAGMPAFKSELRTIERSSQLFAPRVQYQLDEQQKLIAELFFHQNESQGVRASQRQDDKSNSIRLNTRYERNDKQHTDKVRLSAQHQTETQLTRSPVHIYYTDEQIDEYGLGYDAIRKVSPTRQLKFGADARHSQLDSNVSDTLNEQRYALYTEGSWRFTPRQTVTLGGRQEWVNRSGLVSYSDQHISPVLAYRFDLTPAWSLQTSVSQAFRSPSASRLVPTLTLSTDSDAGSLNNPDRGGNPGLKAEKINAFESTLGYNLPAGGVNLTGYYRKIDHYIERVIQQETVNGSLGSSVRFVERPQNQQHATTYGLEASARYALKQTAAGHALMLNSQLSTVRASVEDGQQQRLASDVAPYSASTGINYSYQPWKLSTALNVSYTPEFTRALDNQPYHRTTNQRVNVDLSATKRLTDGWALSVNLRNVFSTDYKERLTYQHDGSLFQSRINQAIPSALLVLEKKF